MLVITGIATTSLPIIIPVATAPTHAVSTTEQQTSTTKATTQVKITATTKQGTYTTDQTAPIKNNSTLTTQQIITTVESAGYTGTQTASTTHETPNTISSESSSPNQNTMNDPATRNITNLTHDNTPVKLSQPTTTYPPTILNHQTRYVYAFGTDTYSSNEHMTNYLFNRTTSAQPTKSSTPGFNSGILNIII